MREVKINRVPFNPNGNDESINNTSKRVPFNPNSLTEGFNPVAYDEGTDKIETTLDFIQKNSLRTMRDDEKDILRDMIKNPNTKKEDLSDAIVTLQGKKAKQQENTITTPDYYMDTDERGVYKPIAIGLGEKIPPHKDVAKVWGTQKSANDDSWYTDLAKTAYNIVPGVIENVIDFAQAGTNLVAGEESDWLIQAKNSINALKMNKDESLNASIYNAEGINEWGDLLDKDRLNFSPDAIWGTVNMALGSVGEMLTVGGAIAKGAKVGAKVATFAASYLTNLGEAMDAAEVAGIKGRDKSAFALAVTVGTAAVDMKLDIGGKILSNQMAKAAKNDIIKELGKRVVKDEFGNITEASLKQVSKEAIAAYAPMAGSFAKTAMKDTFSEGSDEAIQSFISTAGEQLYDKISDEDKTKFGTNALSAASFGKYISEGVAGLVGGGPMSIASANGSRKLAHDAQSNSAYKAVVEGEEGVKAIKTNLNNAFEKGEISKDDLDHAILKVDAYNGYHKTAKDLVLDDSGKQKLLELSFQKENLEASIKSVEEKDKEGHSRLDKLNPAELGLHNAKVKQAKALQDKIDLLVTKSEIEVQPEVAEAIVDKVKKAEEKEKENVTEKKPAEPSSVVTPVDKIEDAPKKKFTETLPKDFNELNDLQKKQATQRHLKETPNKAMDGHILIGQNGKHVVDLGDGKYLTLASSVEVKEGTPEVIRRKNLPKTREEGKKFLGNGAILNAQETDEIGNGIHQPLPSFKEPVVVKRDEFQARDKDKQPVFNEDGTPKMKAVLNVYNKETGEYIVSVREGYKFGSKWIGSNYENELEDLHRIQDTNINTGITDSSHREGGTDGGVVSDKDKPKPTSPVVEPRVKEVVKEDKKEAVKEVKPPEDNKSKEAEIEVKNKKAKDVSVTLELTKNYNALGKKQRKEEAGQKLLKRIHEKAAELGHSLGSNNSGITLLNEKGKQVYEASVKQTEEQKAAKEVLAKIFKSVPQTFREAVLKFFLSKGGKISTADMVRGLGLGSVVGDVVKVNPTGKAEFNARIWAHKKDGKSIDSIVHSIWTGDMNMPETNMDESALIDEFMDVLRESAGKASMIQNLVEEYNSNKNKVDDYASPEMMQEAKDAEEAEKYFNERELTDEEVADLINEEGYRKEYDEYQADKYDDVLQKPQELQYAEGQLSKAENEVTVSKKALDAKRKELDKGVIEDQEDLFGERKSTDTTSLFDERVDVGARDEAVAPFKKRYEAALKELTKWKAKVKELEEKGDSQTSLFQKKAANKGNIDKMVTKLKAAMPSVKVVYDENLKAAGKYSPSTNTVTINPYYAGLDTPIHEFGHILIDAMGYNNKVIQAAIKQLKGSPLFAETKERYKELSEQELEKEVLAEAIGREGANIFNDVTEQSKFKQYLDYIYDWVKRKLGLEKNVAKSLAKQIISGIGTKNINEIKSGKEQLQKEKTYKKSTLRALTLPQYRISKLRNIEAEDAFIDRLTPIRDKAQATYEQMVEDDDATTSELEKARVKFDAAQTALTKARKNLKEDKKAHRQYKEDFAKIQEIIKAKDLNDYTIEELQDTFIQIKGFEEKAAEGLRHEVMLRIAHKLGEAQKAAISKEHTGYIESIADTKDIGKVDVWMMNQSHFTEYQPDVQAGMSVVQQAFLNKTKESNEKKRTHEALARKVIKEENARLGITGKAASLFSSDSAKYFDFLENPKAIKKIDANGKETFESGYYTIDEAKAKGWSKAKIDYLQFTRDTVAERNEGLAANDYANAELNIIKVDKRFNESFKQDGLVQALSYYLGGGGGNLGNVRIAYKGAIMEFKDIEKAIINSVKKGDVQSTIKALFELLKYNFTARKQLKRGFNVDQAQNPLEIKGASEFTINEKGLLVSKFDRPRTKDRGYSKDFYRAMNEFIDDTQHVKHISPTLDIINSLEVLNRDGFAEKGLAIKPHVAQWIGEYKKLHIFKDPHVNDPVLDVSIKFMRKLVASTTMWFNLPANVINVAMGNYNSWRQENAGILGVGNKRLFLGKGKRSGLVNKYALDIIAKYSIVNQDFDSNPKLGFGKIFEKMATIGTQVGEYQIQGSLALGLMSEKDFNSFEYVKDKYGVEQLVVKSTLSEKEVAELEQRMIDHKNRVTDIQGKYPEDDRRNIMRGEIGKAVFQFKVWMPDWYKERFGGRYINSRGQVKEGTFRQVMREGIKQIKADIDSKGVKDGILENKALMSNIKGLATIGLLLVLKYQDDDDEDKRRKAGLAENTLAQVMFVTDLNQMKYMVSNPVAALGKIKDMINAIQALIEFDDTMGDKFKKLVPANKTMDVVKMVSE